MKAHDDQPPVEQRELQVHPAPDVRRKPSGLVQIVPLAQTVVAWIVSSMEIVNCNLTETLPESNGNGGLTADVELLAVSTKAVVVGLRRLPAISSSDARTGRLKYGAEVALTLGPGLVRHGDNANLVGTWTLRTVPGPKADGINRYRRASSLLHPSTHFRPGGGNRRLAGDINSSLSNVPQAARD